MKHIFIVETADDVYLSPTEIDLLNGHLQSTVDAYIGRECASFVQSICNQKSAIRGVYAIYTADVRKSPEDLGSAK